MAKDISLIDLKIGQKAKIINIAGGRIATKRLLDLGLTPNTEIKILRRAPFLGPLQIKVRGSKIILGRGLAAKITVTTE